MRAKLATTLSILALAAAVSACSPKSTTATDSASVAPEMPASGMAGMSDMSGMAMESAAKTGQGVGEITAIDTKAATVTIKHDAIPAVDWPAMTMAFKANPASLLSGLKVGEKVTFDVSVKGSDADVTAIQPK
ncbi:MAG: copper-binding protein [Asticcacaulis sp.]